MAKLNDRVKSEPIYTHGGGKASHISSMQELRRSVLACMLWENEFYEDGEEISNRIISLIQNMPKNKLDDVAKLAVEARTKQHLRHVPLLICDALASVGYKVANTLAEVIQRPDELTEMLAIYWKDGKVPIAKQVKKGLAKAFTKFNEYSLAKYNQDRKIKLRDVLFLVHAKPLNDDQAALWKRLVDNKLLTPDTWEVELSASKDKKDSWERLLKEEKLGSLAMLRNLRNMENENVDSKLISNGIMNADYSKVLPFRFFAAAQYAPRYAEELNTAFINSFVKKQDKLKGKTILIIDISGSMKESLSEKSDMTRIIAACSLAPIMRELCENVAIYATSGNDYTRKHATSLVPNYRGLPLAEAIPRMREKLGEGGIFLNQVCKYIAEKEMSADRTIVITDEQDCSGSDSDSPLKATPLGKGYMINVASAKNGIGYGKWIHIDGFSEACVNYILESEKEVLQ